MQVTLRTRSLTLLLGLALTAPATGAPLQITKIPLAEAVAANKTDGRVLVVSVLPANSAAQASHRMMVDDMSDIGAWVRDQGVAVETDVNTARALLGPYQGARPPSLIALKQGEILGRMEGQAWPREALLWLNGLLNDQAPTVEEIIAAERDDPAVAVDVHARSRAVTGLITDGRFHDATIECVWLWKHMAEREPGMFGVRRSFFAGDLKKLVGRFEPARAVFLQTRDAIEPRAIRADPDPQALSDWIVLNEIVQDEAATLRWFDGVKREPGGMEHVRSVSFLLDGLLLERSRWDDLALFGRTPMGELERAVRQREEMARLNAQRLGQDAPEGSRAAMKQAEEGVFRLNVGRIYGSLLAGERLQDAEAVAAKAREIDPNLSMLRALVEAAIQAEHVLPMHADWATQVDESREFGAPNLSRSVRETLERAGAKK